MEIILQNQDTDVHRIFKHFQIDGSRLAADLIGALDKLPRGATAISDFSPAIVQRLPNAISASDGYAKQAHRNNKPLASCGLSAFLS